MNDNTPSNMNDLPSRLTLEDSGSSDSVCWCEEKSDRSENENYDMNDTGSVDGSISGFSVEGSLNLNRFTHAMNVNPLSNTNDLPSRFTVEDEVSSDSDWCEEEDEFSEYDMDESGSSVEGSLNLNLFTQAVNDNTPSNMNDLLSRLTLEDGVSSDSEWCDEEDESSDDDIGSSVEGSSNLNRFTQSMNNNHPSNTNGLPYYFTLEDDVSSDSDWCKEEDNPFDDDSSSDDDSLSASYMDVSDDQDTEDENGCDENSDGREEDGNDNDNIQGWHWYENYCLSRNDKIRLVWEKSAMCNLHTLIFLAWICRHRIISTKEANILWDLLEERLRADPDLARILDVQGRHPIHHCVHSHPPLSSVQALIAAYPQALGIKDHSRGMLPIHCISDLDYSRESSSIGMAFLRAYPQGVQTKDNNGRLPLHHWVISSSLDLMAFWELLKYYPEGAKTKSVFGVTPFNQLYLDSDHLVIETIEHNVSHRRRNNGQITDGNLFQERESNLLWSKVQLLLMTLHHGALPMQNLSSDEVGNMQKLISVPIHLSNNEKYMVLHACVATGLFPRIVDIMLALYGDQLKQKDSRGRLPLHWASETSNPDTFYCVPCCEVKSETIWYDKNVTDISKSMCEDCYRIGLRFAVGHGMDPCIKVNYSDLGKGQEIETSYNGEDFLFFKQELLKKSTFEKIFEAYPDAANETDEDGCLPLHHAVLSGNSRGVSILLSNFPHSLHIPDPRTGLLPYYAVVMLEKKHRTLEWTNLVYGMQIMNPDYIKEATRTFAEA